MKISLVTLFLLLITGVYTIEVQAIQSVSDPVTYLAWDPANLRFLTVRGSVITIAHQENGNFITIQNNAPRSYIRSVRWHPLRAEILAGTEDGWMRRWNADTGQLIASYQHSSALDAVGQPHHVLSVDWSPNGQRMLSASTDGYFKIWDAQSHAVLHMITDSTTHLRLTWAAWSPDGNWIATGATDAKIRIWNATTLALTSTLIDHSGMFREGTWRYDSQRLATIADDLVWLTDDISSMTDRAIRVWNMSTGQVSYRVLTGVEELTHLQWSPEGGRIASGSHRGWLKIWNAQTGALMESINVGGAITALAWRPDGSQIAVATVNPDGRGGSSQIINPPPSPTTPNVVTNGNFDTNTNGWSSFATPNASDVQMQWNAGILQFRRLTSATSAAVLQNTGINLTGGTRFEARFDVGNTSGVRKRVVVVLHDAAFSDQQSCVFWLAPSAPLRTYFVQSINNVTWSPAYVSFYEGTSDGNGWIQIDNVSLRQQPQLNDLQTLCIDPNAPPPSTGSDSANFLANPNFSSGLSPWWVSDTTWQLTGGIMDWYSPQPPSPNTAVIQDTNTSVGLRVPLELTLQLGNNSSVRKRISVIINDGDWSDSQSCFFWLPNNWALQTYTMRTYTTEAWSEAHISVYDSSRGNPWTRMDNVSLRTRPTMSVRGTECYRPGAIVP